MSFCQPPENIFPEKFSKKSAALPGASVASKIRSEVIECTDFRAEHPAVHLQHYKKFPFFLLFICENHLTKQ